MVKNDRIMRPYRYEFTKNHIKSFMPKGTPVYIPLHYSSKLKGEFLEHIVFDLILSVNAIHSRNIIHNDIKPENMIMINGRMVLIDWNIAMLLLDEVIDNEIHTYDYRPPECLLEEHVPHTFLADMWAIASSIYKIATGKYLISDSSLYTHLYGNGYCVIYEQYLTKNQLKIIIEEGREKFNSIPWITKETKFIFNHCLEFEYTNRPTSDWIISNVPKLLETKCKEPEKEKIVYDNGPSDEDFLFHLETAFKKDIKNKIWDNFYFKKQADITKAEFNICKQIIGFYIEKTGEQTINSLFVADILRIVKTLTQCDIFEFPVHQNFVKLIKGCFGIELFLNREVEFKTKIKINTN